MDLSEIGEELGIDMGGMEGVEFDEEAFMEEGFEGMDMEGLGDIEGLEDFDFEDLEGEFGDFFGDEDKEYEEEEEQEEREEEYDTRDHETEYEETTTT